mgnify:CR=1 FL=1
MTPSIEDMNADSSEHEAPDMDIVDLVGDGVDMVLRHFPRENILG